MKKLIVAIVVILIIAGVVFLGYYLRSRNESTTPTPPPGLATNTPGIQLPTTTTGGSNSGQTVAPIENLKIAVNTSTLDYFVDAKSAVTFVKPDGQILKTSGGGFESLSASVIKNISRASFSFDGKKILAAMEDPLGNQASIFDTERKTWQPLPQNAHSAAWSPNSHQIAYFSGASNASVLSLLDAADPAPKPKVLLPLQEEDMTLNWLSPNQLLIADKTSAVWNSSLWSLDPTKKIISPIIQDRPGLQTVWNSSSSPFGLIFFANPNQRGGQLQLVDKSGNILKRLSFLTLPSKCLFYDKPFDATQGKPASSTTASASTTTSSSSIPRIASSLIPLPRQGSGQVAAGGIPKTQLTLICAVPRGQQTLSTNVLPDAYQEKTLFTSDDFFEINVGDGNVKTLFSDPAKNLDASNLKIFNQNLFFVNRFDKKVYSVPLGK